MLWLHGMCSLAGTAIAVGSVGGVDKVLGHLRSSRGLVAYNGTIDAGPIDLYLAKLSALVGALADANQYLDRAREVVANSGATGWEPHLEAVQEWIQEARRRHSSHLAGPL